MDRPGAHAALPHEGNGAVVTTGVGASAIGSYPAGATRVEPVTAPVVMPRRRGLSGSALAALAALAGAGAVALGAWGVATTLSDDDTTPSSTAPVALENVQQVVSLIGKPTTATIPVQGSGRKIILVVGASGYGVLVLNGLASPPAGKTYQAWVIRPSVKAPAPAGIFTGGTGIVTLTKRVPPGGVVAITVEPRGGSPAPTQQPKLVASRT
jgi:anti-sigma-K factor RskA